MNDHKITYRIWKCHLHCALERKMYNRPYYSSNKNIKLKQSNNLLSNTKYRNIINYKLILNQAFIPVSGLWLCLLINTCIPLTR